MQIIAIVTPSKIPDACGGTPVIRQINSPSVPQILDKHYRYFSQSPEDDCKKPIKKSLIRPAPRQSQRASVPRCLRGALLFQPDFSQGFA